MSIRNCNEKALNITVTNEGHGIPKDELNSVFDKCYRCRDVAENTDGTGLGLYIVKQIIESHGQTITVNSKLGEYCEFCFSLAKGDINGR